MSYRVFGFTYPFLHFSSSSSFICTSSYQNSILAYNFLNLCHLSHEFVKLPFYPYSPFALKFSKNIILTFIIPLNCNKLLGYNLGCYNSLSLKRISSLKLIPELKSCGYCASLSIMVFKLLLPYRGIAKASLPEGLSCSAIVLLHDLE